MKAGKSAQFQKWRILVVFTAIYLFAAICSAILGGLIAYGWIDRPTDDSLVLFLLMCGPPVLVWTAPLYAIPITALAFAGAAFASHTTSRLLRALGITAAIVVWLFLGLSAAGLVI